MKMKKVKKHRNEVLKAVSTVSHIGVVIAACLFVGVMLGKFLDDFFGTSPWLLLLFSLLGCASAMKSMYDILTK